MTYGRFENCQVWTFYHIYQHNWSVHKNPWNGNVSKLGRVGLGWVAEILEALGERRHPRLLSQRRTCSKDYTRESHHENPCNFTTHQRFVYKKIHDKWQFFMRNDTCWIILYENLKISETKFDLFLGSDDNLYSRNRRANVFLPRKMVQLSSMFQHRHGLDNYLKTYGYGYRKIFEIFQQIRKNWSSQFFPFDSVKSFFRCYCLNLGEKPMSGMVSGVEPIDELDHHCYRYTQEISLKSVQFFEIRLLINKFRKNNKPWKVYQMSKNRSWRLLHPRKYSISGQFNC